jgi:hypothetical protein
MTVTPSQDALLRAMSRTTIHWTTGCLLYEGSHSGTGRGGGYPRISYRGQTCGLHILAFEQYHGRRVRKGYFLDHLCETRNCWNPLHLEEVKQSVNEKRKHRRRKKAPVAVPAEWVNENFEKAYGVRLSVQISNLPTHLQGASLQVNPPSTVPLEGPLDRMIAHGRWAFKYYGA